MAGARSRRSRASNGCPTGVTGSSSIRRSTRGTSTGWPSIRPGPSGSSQASSTARSSTDYDGGRTWQEALVGYDLHRVAVDPADPDRILAAAGEGLFISDDAARTWNPVPALRGKYVHAIVFDPHLALRIYVYVAEEGVPLYRSEDSGQTWTQIGGGLPAARPADNLAAHPTVAHTVFYGVDSGEQAGRLFVSSDAGDTWRALPVDLPKIWRLRAAAIPARDPG